MLVVHPWCSTERCVATEIGGYRTYTPFPMSWEQYIPPASDAGVFVIYLPFIDATDNTRWH